MRRYSIAIAAVALLIAGCGGLPTPTTEQPAEAVEVAEVVEAPPEDFLGLGKTQGYEAVVAAQTATENQWYNVTQQWELAVRTLGQVPADRPDYTEAQAKIAEYNANRDVAAERYRVYQVGVNQEKIEVNQARAESSPAPMNSYRNDPAATALAAYEDEIRKADPDRLAVTKIEGLGMEGAAGVTVTEAWQLLPAVSRENNAKDLHNIWVLEVVKAGGSRSTAQILIFNRHGKTIAQVHPGGVRLKE